MKKYFFIKDLYASLLNNTGIDVRLNLISLKIDNVEQLTPAFSTDYTPTFKSYTSYNYAEVQSTIDLSGNTTVNSVNPSGVINYFNPLPELMGLTFNQTNGIDIGDAVNTVSGNSFGIISAVAPGTDRAKTTTQLGNNVSCPFYMNIDFSKDFFMLFSVDIRKEGDTTFTRKYHKYTHNASLCSFSYETYDVVEEQITNIQGFTAYAFLSPILEDGWGEYSCITPALCKGTLTKKLAQRISPQAPAQIDDRGFDECCYENLALASSTSTEKFENDYKSWMFKRDLPSDTYTLTLIKNGGGPGNEFSIIDNTYGEYYDFGDFADKPNLKGFKLEWRNVLLLQGEGKYHLKLEYTILGTSYTNESIVYDLRQFTTQLADTTFRLDTVMNSYLKWLDIDFRGLKWQNSVRWEGFFGRRKESYETEELAYADDDGVRDITKELINNYNLQVLLAPECITKEIVEYHLFADQIFANDYNGNNHSYSYKNFPIRLSEAEEPNQYDTTRLETKNYIFTDRFRDKRKSNC